MREVEVAVGFIDHTWRDLWVDVPEDADHVLDDEEVKEKALKITEETARQADWSVSFVYIMYIKPPEDDLNGLV